MKIAEIIAELISGEQRRIMAAAEAAAEALELLEERIAIMGEMLTENEWGAMEEEARRRLEGRR